MKKLSLSALFSLLLFCAAAQDSASNIQKSYRHEIGFNAVRLLSQLPLIEVPADQLPYDVFYNFWFNDQVGIRFGAGLIKQNFETNIPGQAEPRVTNLTDINLRLGLNYNFARAGALTFNSFADVVWQNKYNNTVTTTTMQIFGNPVSTTTVRNEETTLGFGGQIGLGINLKIYKNLCLYTELPLTFLSSSTDTRDEVHEEGGSIDVEKSNNKNSEVRITLPATVYLVLRF